MFLFHISYIFLIQQMSSAFMYVITILYIQEVPSVFREDARNDTGHNKVMFSGIDFPYVITKHVHRVNSINN